jgi:hypothetical protein
MNPDSKKVRLKPDSTYSEAVPVKSPAEAGATSGGFF